jgi:hypothetical protein
VLSGGQWLDSLHGMHALHVYSFISTASKKKYTVWKKPQDRTLLSEEMLLEKGLI